MYLYRHLILVGSTKDGQPIAFHQAFRTEDRTEKIISRIHAAGKFGMGIHSKMSTYVSWDKLIQEEASMSHYKLISNLDEFIQQLAS